MTQKINISPWPSTFSNPRWSKDGELAVALGEYVEVIIPKLRSSRQSIKDIAAKGLAWDHIRLRVNLFTEDESPTVEPASYRTWSIGEEISIITATAIEWTPPGLARYKRSALGVLTSNHVLALWSPDARLNEASQWKRELIFNRLLSAGGSQDEVADRRCQRIRAFAFSSTLRNRFVGSAEIINDTEIYLVSLTNDFGEIFVVKISSPFVPFRKGEDWSAAVVARHQPDATVKNDPPPRSSILSDYLTSQQTVDQLAWSEWYPEDGGAHTSILAFLSERVRCCRIVASLETDRAEPKIQVDKEEILQEVDVYNGPVGWVPRAFSISASPLLYSFGKDNFRCTEISISDLSSSKHSALDVDDRWDIITGVAFCWAPSNAVTVYNSTHIYRKTSRGLDTRLTKDRSQFLSTEEIVWQAEILAELSQFKAEHSLGSDPFARIWGMASSPLKDFMCISYSLHPSNMLEYTIPAEQTCRLRIIPSGKLAEKFRVPWIGYSAPEGGTSTEIAVLSLQLWLKDQQIGDINETFKMIYKDITTSYDLNAFLNGERKKCSQYKELLASTEASSLSKAVYIIEYLKHRINSDVEYKVNQARFLLLSAFSTKFPAGNLSALQLYHVVKCALELPKLRLRPTGLSKTIRNHFLLATEGDASQRNGFNEIEASETCKICESDIPFESTTWAKCASGHLFSRCGLTMVAIQVPGKSKLCGICGQQFLRDEHSANSLLGTDTLTDAPDEDQERVSKNNEPLDVSLAELLFAACDTCLYCGGKYLN